MFDVAVVGCGITGAAAAYALSRYDVSVLVLEAANDVADGATKANSAILHAGYDPRPGTLMARLNVDGVRLAKELCEKLDVPYRQCGSLVLAFSDEELSTLQELLARGRQNGVPDMRVLSGAEALAMEPNLNPDVRAALFAPSAAIVSPWEYCLALAETAVRNGVQLETGRAVTSIARIGGGYELTAGGKSYAAKAVLNAGGAYAGEIHNMVAPPTFRSIPARGEYYLLDRTAGASFSSAPPKRARACWLRPPCTAI